MAKAGVWDARAKWDQMLDNAEPDWATAARNVGDSVAIAASILKHEVGSVPDHASVVALAALIVQRVDSERAESAASWARFKGGRDED